MDTDPACGTDPDSGALTHGVKAKTLAKADQTVFLSVSIRVHPWFQLLFPD